MPFTSFLSLGIESSCDETSAAVVRDGTEVRSVVVRSQIDVHRVFGGVVPELACRAHVESIVPVIEEALAQAGARPADVDAVAVTNSPGLVGALLVGVSAAKALALAWGKPLIGVNHVEAHLWACRMACPELAFPCVGLVVSGGHTSLFHCRSPLAHEKIGATRDDAAGEAFDKAAAILGLPFPGGPSIEKAARGGDLRAVRFRRTMLGPGSLDFSFSGIKTAVLYEVIGQAAFRAPPRGSKVQSPSSKVQGPESKVQSLPIGPGRSGPGTVDGGPGTSVDPRRVSDLCASFQEAVVDVLVAKTLRAAERHGVRQVAVGGGVACNGRLREKLTEAAAERGIRAYFPPPAFCTDNAAMIAGLAFPLAQAGRFADLALDVVPT